MYTVDDRDRVVEWDLPPQSSPGSPVPELVSSEFDLALAYYLDDLDTERYGKPQDVHGAENDDLVAVLRFDLGPYAFFFGPPNDEAFSGHPLEPRGLGPYGTYEVVESSWIRALERMNSVHHQHDTEGFLDGLHHFVVSFHDSTFECVARSEPSVHVYRGTVRAAMLDALQSFRD